MSEQNSNISQPGLDEDTVKRRIKFLRDEIREWNRINDNIQKYSEEIAYIQQEYGQKLFVAAWRYDN